jgi:DNA transformation protein
MKQKDSFAAFVQEQLAPLGDLRSKSMFGGHGFYHRETLFGMEYKGKVFFRVDDITRPRYEEFGMPPFSPAKGMTMKKYYEVPLEVVEDSGELTRWARDAVKAAGDAAKAKAKPAAKKAPAKRTSKPSKPAPRPRGR